MMIRINLLHPLMTDLYHVPNRVTHTFQRGAAWNNVGIHYNHPTWTDDQGLDIEQITDKALLFQLGAYNPSDNICRLILCKNG